MPWESFINFKRMRKTFHYFSVCRTNIFGLRRRKNISKVSKIASPLFRSNILVQEKIIFKLPKYRTLTAILKLNECDKNYDDDDDDDDHDIQI